MTVVNLKGKKADVDARCEAVSEMCDRVSAMAREGRIVSAAIAYVGADGACYTLWESQGNVNATIGTVAIMMAEMTGARPRE